MKIGDVQSDHNMIERQRGLHHSTANQMVTIQYAVTIRMPWYVKGQPFKDLFLYEMFPPASNLKSSVRLELVELDGYVLLTGYAGNIVWCFVNL